MGGGFSNILGHVATGFTQAAQVDKQRQFEGEMESRRQAGDLLQKLAFDETASPETRNAAAAEFGNLHSVPWNKQYKLDLHKTGIIRPPQSMTTPGLSAPQPPPSGAQPSFAAGAAGAPPQMSMPAPPPGLSQAMTGAGAGTVSTPGQPTFKPPAQQAQEAAQMVGATTGAQITGQIGARQEALKSMQGLPPDQQAMAMGIPGVYAAMLRSRLAGAKVQMTADQAMQDPELAPLMQSSGYNAQTPGLLMVTHDRTGAPIKIEPTTPTQTLGTSSSGQTTDPVTGLTTKSSSQRQRILPGQKMSTPAPPPGMALPASRPNVPVVGAPLDNTIGGRAIPAAAIGIISSQARNYERSGITPTGKTAPIVQQYMEENGMVPHTTQQVSDYQKGFDQAMAEDKRLKMMSDLAQKVAGDPTPDNIGSYDAALLAYHMGMTVGQVKGMRSGKDMVLLHEKARSLPESLRQAAESWVNGAQLSPEQRSNFVDLAKQSRQAAWSQAVTEAKGMGFSRFPQPTPGLPPLGLWPGVVNKQQLTSLAKDHHISYGDARKQAISAGMNVQD